MKKTSVIEVNGVQISKYIKQPVQTVDGKIKLKMYEKLKQVGSGSYSRCYLVKNVHSSSTYVVKIIPKSKLEILTKQKLIYEIKIHQSLAHHNVVHLDHWYEDQQNQYIFMEYCSKGNLQMTLARKEKTSQQFIKYYGRQIVDGIAYIHSQNILHRDLKLCNFYIDESDQVKLGDFGFACQLANQDDRKRQTCGTPNYIAPQAISGYGYSFSSDIWSIGVILYRLKYRFCPFEGTTVQKTLENVKTCNFIFPKIPKISPQLKDLIIKILNINYDQRLTVQEILNHPFFQGSDELLMKNNGDKSEQKKGFSLKNIFSKEKKKKQENSKSKKKQNQKQKQKQMEVLKRSNSCETFKQIKSIFKSKSKPNLTTTSQNSRVYEMNTLNTLNNYTLTTIPSNREQYSGKTNRNIIEMAFNQTSRKQQPSRTTKLNQFVKNQAQTLSQKEIKIEKVAGKNLKISENKTNNTSKQLAYCCKKFYLPLKIKNEKDIIIIHYKPSIKQIIYQNTSYLIHRKIDNIYDLKGEKVNIQNISKLLKHILQNKITIKEYEDDEEQFGEINMDKILLSVAHSWIQKKEGIILKYGTFQTLLVAKLNQQQAFYAYEEQKLCFMYQNLNGIYKLYDGVLAMKIYSNWVKTLKKVD